MFHRNLAGRRHTRQCINSAVFLADQSRSRCIINGEIARRDVHLHQWEVVYRCNFAKEDVLFRSRNALHTTINTSSNPPLPHTCTENKWRSSRSSQRAKEGKYQNQMVWHQSVSNPVLTSWQLGKKCTNSHPILILWENSHPALELLRAVFSPHCSSPCTQTTAHLKTPLSSSWSLQTTPYWSASSRNVTSLLTDRRLRSWLSGAVLTTWSLTHSKQWIWSWTSGETPPALPPTYHHEQHCDCRGVIQIPGHHNFSGPEVGQSHWVPCEKGSAEAVLPSPAEDVQPATGAADTVFCHHWLCPLHVNNCLIQLSYQIWPQKTTEGSPDCWANHWYNPTHSPGTVLIQSEQKGWQNHSGPLTSRTLPLWTVTVWSTLQSSEYQNDQTQEQFLSPSNPSHEHSILNMEHTTLLYNYLFTTHPFFLFLFFYVRPVHT